MSGVLVSMVAREQQLDRPRGRPWDKHGALDVEALVHWAYAVQMVDRFERSGLHAIEAAAAGFEVRGRSADGVGQLMQINNLGCRVDNGGVLVTDTVHAAAYAVASALRGVEGEQLVRVHGMAGTRPNSWVPPVHRVRPAMWNERRDGAVVEYQGPGRKGAYCQVLYVWDEARQAWGREVYRQWWAGLEELAWRLSARALGFTVTGPAAPLEPWAAGPGAPPNGSSHPAKL